MNSTEIRQNDIIERFEKLESFNYVVYCDVNDKTCHVLHFLSGDLTGNLIVRHFMYGEKMI